MNIQIIDFRPEYTEQVVAVTLRVLRDQKVIPESDKPVDDTDLLDISDVYFRGGRFWVAIDQGKVIGTVAIRDMGGDVAKLNRMFVLTAYHGKGVGQALLETALDFAKNQGFKKLILVTHILMKRAHHFYEKNGFEKVAEDPDKYDYVLTLYSPFADILGQITNCFTRNSSMCKLKRQNHGLYAQPACNCVDLRLSQQHDCLRLGIQDRLDSHNTSHVMGRIPFLPSTKDKVGEIIQLRPKNTSERSDFNLSFG